MEEKLKTKEELLAEYEDKIIELEQQLESVNECLSEKIKLTENLEEDIFHLREKQNLQRNVMRSEKETMTCEELCLENEKLQTPLSDISCQTEFPDLVDSEVNTDDIKLGIKIKNETQTRLSLYTNEKSLQTSFLDNTQQERILELENLKELFAALEIESESKKTVNYFLRNLLKRRFCFRHFN